MGQCQDARPRTHGGDHRIGARSGTPHTSVMSVTLDVSHAEMGWSNALAFQNTPLRERGRARGREEELRRRSWWVRTRVLANRRPEHQRRTPHTNTMFVTLDVSHAETDWLNAVASWNIELSERGREQGCREDEATLGGGQDAGPRTRNPSGTERRAQNTNSMSVTLDVSHPEMGWLNASTL